jgi:hypothetical protein
LRPGCLGRLCRIFEGSPHLGPLLGLKCAFVPRDKIPRCIPAVERAHFLPSPPPSPRKRGEGEIKLASAPARAAATRAQGIHSAPALLPPRPACGERAGVRGAQVAQYFLQHHLSLFQRCIVPEANNPKTFRFEESCSCGIFCGLLRVLTTIQLHDQPLFEADKIYDIWWDRVLAPKLEFAQAAVFQVTPKAQFRFGG